MESTIYTVAGKDFELQHHGIKGMRWGVRRFQEKDGSLTQAGKKRYSDESPDAGNKTSTDNKSGGRHEAVRKLAGLREDLLRKSGAIQDKLDELYEERAKIDDAYYSTDSKSVQAQLEKQYAELEKRRSPIAAEKEKLWADARKRDKALTKSIFESEDVKPALENARLKQKELKALYGKLTSPDSDAYKRYAAKKAESLKKRDPTYFNTEAKIRDAIRETWPYSKEHDRVVKEYWSPKNKTRKEYEAAVADLGKAVIAGMNDRGYNKWATEAARDYLNGHKVTSILDDDY